MNKVTTALLAAVCAVCAATAPVAPARAAARASAGSPAPLGAQSSAGPAEPTGPARVVRLEATREQLAAARARLAARGVAIDFILWTSSAGDLVGATPDASLDLLAGEGIGAERLFDTIADYQAGRAAGSKRSAGLEPPAGPAYATRVVVVGLGRSGRATLPADSELVLRANDRYAAVLDAGTGDDPDAEIAARYAGRGLAVASATSLEAFPAASVAYFPEDPYTSADVRDLDKVDGAEGAYTSYDEMAAGLANLAATNSSLVRIVSIGKSYEGRDLWAVKISSNAGVDDPAKPAVLFTGCYHAREWISVEVPYALALQLPVLYRTDPRVRHLLDTVAVWILPLANPDGHVYTQQRPNHTDDDVRLWRKNRRPIDLNGDGVMEGLGVDLNRNHGYVWRLPTDQPYPVTNDDVGASDDPASFQLYRGPAAGSEPEIQALDRFTGDASRHVVARLDYHNYGQLVLYPVGFTRDPSPDDALFRELGGVMKATIARSRGTAYTLEQSISLYPTTGSSDDYAYGQDRQIAYTIELAPRGGGFDLDESQIAPVVAENLPAALDFADWATGPASVESVSVTRDGETKYGAHWVDAGGARSLHVDDLAAGGEGTPSHVEVTFSRPLGAAPRFTMTAGGDEVAFDATEAPARRYAGDTWSGDVTIPNRPDGGEVRLRVALDGGAAGVAGFDANPATVGSYAVGTGFWLGREPGSDESYVVVPANLDTPPRVSLLGPVAGPAAPDGLPSTSFLAGSEVAVTWQATDDRQLVSQRLEYSADGGATYSPATDSELSTAVREYAWTPPKRLASAAVILRIAAVDDGGHETSVVSAPFAVSRAGIAKAPVFKNDKLRVAMRAGSLRGAGIVSVEVDGVAVDPSLVKANAATNKVVVRATAEQLGLVAGQPAEVRVVVGGVPTPAVSFTP